MTSPARDTCRHPDIARNLNAREILRDYEDDRSALEEDECKVWMDFNPLQSKLHGTIACPNSQNLPTATELMRQALILSYTIFMVLSSCLKHCEFTLAHAMNAARRQVAADLWTKPIGLNHKPTLTIAILSLLSAKADTHFTIPRRVEG